MARSPLRGSVKCGRVLESVLPLHALLFQLEVGTSKSMHRGQKDDLIFMVLVRTNVVFVWRLPCCTKCIATGHTQCLLNHSTANRARSALSLSALDLSPLAALRKLVAGRHLPIHLIVDGLYNIFTIRFGGLIPHKNLPGQLHLTVSKKSSIDHS